MKRTAMVTTAAYHIIEHHFPHSNVQSVRKVRTRSMENQSTPNCSAGSPLQPLQSVHPRCPRCDYNLVGMSSPWVENRSCPLTGKCSECGLDFEWGHILATTTHPWLFEYHRPGERIKRFWRTLLKSFIPQQLWREVRLTDPVRLKRLFWMPILLLIALIMARIASVELLSGGWFFNALFEDGSFWESPLVTVQSYTDWFPRWSLHLIWHRDYYPVWETVPFYSNACVLAVVWSFVMVLSFGLLPVSVRRAKVAKRHLVRVAVYSLLPLILYLILWAAVDLGMVIAYPRQLIVRLLSVFGLIFILIPMWGAWQLLCWNVACKKYLKLPNPYAVGTMLNVVAGLVTALFFVYWLLLP